VNKRRSIASRSICTNLNLPCATPCLRRTAILLLFAFAGAALLGALGIGIPAFRIAGGILLFFLALDMIFASPTGLRSRTVREQEEISYEHDVSVFPLAIPLLAGPGAITTVLLYTGGGDLTGIVVFVAVLLTRVLGVLLAALAVQFVLGGIESSLG
jgi:multiple antibiotic resistance protein